MRRILLLALLAVACDDGGLLDNSDVATDGSVADARPEAGTVDGGGADVQRLDGGADVSTDGAMPDGAAPDSASKDAFVPDEGTDGPAPDPDMALPDPDMMVPPDPDMMVPDPDMMVPDPDMMVVPDPDMMVVPDPDMRVPDPDMLVQPDPDMFVPPDPDMMVPPDPDMGVDATPPPVDGVNLRWGRIRWTAGPTGSGNVTRPAQSRSGQLKLRGALRSPIGGP